MKKLALTLAVLFLSVPTFAMCPAYLSTKSKAGPEVAGALVSSSLLSYIDGYFRSAATGEEFIRAGIEIAVASVYQTAAESGVNLSSLSSERIGQKIDFGMGQIKADDLTQLLTLWIESLEGWSSAKSTTELTKDPSFQYLINYMGSICEKNPGMESFTKLLQDALPVWLANYYLAQDPH